MKRNLLFNKIISLSLIGALYLSMSISAYADAADTEVPVEAPAIVASESVPEDIPPADEGSDENITAGETNGETTEVTTSDSTSEDTSDDITSEGNDPAGEPLDGESDSDEDKLSDGTSIVVDEGNEIANSILEEDEESEDEELEDEEEAEEEELEEEEEEEEEECEHELSYTSNKDGSHTVTCSLCDMEEYTESCEYDEDGVCIYCGYKRLPDPILVYEDGDVIVTVSGAIPENADLKVTPIKDSNDNTAETYSQIEDTLINETGLAEAEEYGFLAYDICFIDIESKEEVEPAGDVTVNIEYKAAYIPSEISEDENTSPEIELLHFNEVTDGIENMTDSGKANLSLDSQSAITNAEFTSDTFSIFVIKWTQSNTSRYVKIVTTCYSKENEELSEFTTNETTKTITGQNPAETIIKDAFATEEFEGYRYLRAEYEYNGTIYEVDRFKYSRDNNNRYISLYNVNTQVGTRIALASKDADAQHISIGLIYERDAELTITKKATGDPALDTNTTYEFTLKDANGNSVGAVNYFVGNEKRTTVDGKFNLKSGESAYFNNKALADGTYTVIESGINGDAYVINDFMTKVLLDGNVVQTYEAEFTGERSITVPVVADSNSDVVFRNYYTITTFLKNETEEKAKYIRYMPDKDYYELALKFRPPEYSYETQVFEGEATTTMEPKKVDIILVVDKSGSMKTNDRMTHLNGAVKLLADIFKSKRTVDARWKVIYFDNSATLASNTQNWVTSDQLSTSATPEGATNYQAALELTQQQVLTARSDAESIVIFLTDGEPTKYGNNLGAGSSFDNEAYLRAKEAAFTLTCDSFYAIGVDFGSTTHKITERDGYVHYLNPRGILEGVVEAAEKVPNKSTSTVKADEIVDLFRNMAGSITSHGSDDSTTTLYEYKAENVVITDPLSDYVDIRPNSEFYVSIEIDGHDIWQTTPHVNGYINANGVEDHGATFEITDGGTVYQMEAHYIVTDEGERLMQVTFPQGYKLNSDFTYKLGFEVVPSELAYDTYLESGYNAVGEKDTDHAAIAPANWTSQGKDGFFSNKDATVKYKYKGKDETLHYPHPVVQVKFKNVWEIYKINTEGTYLNGAEFRLQEAGVDIASALTYTGTSSLVGSTDGLVVWNLGENEKIQKNKTYSLVETAAPTGYVKSEENWVITISDENVPTVRMITADNPNGTEYVVEPIRMKDTYIYRFNFVNTNIYSLPSTGGNGIYKTTLVGIVMMMTSVYMFYRNRRRQRAVR